MSTIIIDGRVRVTFATAVAAIAAPTAAEANAGTALETYIRPDGLEIAVGTNSVDNSNLGSTFTTNRAGRKVPTGKLTMHHNSPTNTPWALTVYRTAGFLIVRMGVDRTTAWAAGDKVKVYPIEFGEFEDAQVAPDSNWDFMVPMFFTDDFSQRAVMA